MLLRRLIFIQQHKTWNLKLEENLIAKILIRQRTTSRENFQFIFQNDVKHIQLKLQHQQQLFQEFQQFLGLFCLKNFASILVVPSHFPFSRTGTEDAQQGTKGNWVVFEVFSLLVKKWRNVLIRIGSLKVLKSSISTYSILFSLYHQHRSNLVFIFEQENFNLELWRNFKNFLKCFEFSNFFDIGNVYCSVHIFSDIDKSFIERVRSRGIILLLPGKLSTFISGEKVLLLFLEATTNMAKQKVAFSDLLHPV